MTKSLNRCSTKKLQLYPVNVTILGVRRLLTPSKSYLFMVMVLWNDDSELIIYRSLSQIRTLIKRIEQIALANAKSDLRQTTRPLKKRHFLGDNRLCVHLKHIENVNRLFAIFEFYKPLLYSNACQNFFYKRKESLTDAEDVLATSFIIVNHSKLESDKYRNKIRKSMCRLNGQIERIADKPYAALDDLVPENNDELALTKGEMCNVISKSPTGWWLAQRQDTDEFGWVPADYLCPMKASLNSEENTSKDGISNPSFHKSENAEFITIQRYDAKDDTEVSFDRHCIVTVIEESDHGWWKVRYNQKVGLAPACFLKPYTDPMISIGHTMQQSHMM